MDSNDGRATTGLGLADAGRRAILAGITGLVSRAASILVIAVTLPIALGSLGEERFGLWMLINSLVMSFGFLDFGLANGMLTSLAEASASECHKRIREIVATGVVLLTAIGALILTVCGAVVPAVDWHSLLNVTVAVPDAEVTAALIVLIGLIGIGIPASAVQRIYFGLQRGAQANLWQALGGLLSLAGVWLAARTDAGLPAFVAAAVGGPILGWLLGGATLLIGPAAIAAPRLSNFSPQEGRRLSRDALLYFVLQLSAAIALYSDNALLAAARGTAELASFSTTARVFGIISMAASVMAYPLWATFGLAVGRGEYGWITRQFGKTLTRTTALAAVVSAVLVAIFEPLMQLWLGTHAPEFDVRLVLAFSLWTVLQAAGAVVSSLLNAIRAVKLQVVIAAVFTPACVWLKWRWAAGFGPVGIVLAACVCYVTLALVPYFFYLRRWLQARNAASVPAQ